MRLYRIADRRHRIRDGSGAALHGGRWNSPGNPAIYAATSYSGALLEVLAHLGRATIPPTQAYVIVDVPASVLVLEQTPQTLPGGWSAPDSIVARQVGDDWLAAQSSAVLLVPSAIAQHDFNAIINPRHRAFKRLKPSVLHDVVWDRRLF